MPYDTMAVDTIVRQGETILTMGNYTEKNVFATLVDSKRCPLTYYLLNKKETFILMQCPIALYGIKHKKKHIIQFLINCLEYNKELSLCCESMKAEIPRLKPPYYLQCVNCKYKKKKDKGKTLVKKK